MKVLVLLACVVAVVSAEHCCSMEDRKEVQRLWQSVWSAQYSGRRVAVAQAVFNSLFERAPGTKDLFKRVNVDDIDSPEFRAHCVRVINGVDTVIHMSFNMDVLRSHLDHLAMQHAARDGVQIAHFDIMADAFEEVLSQAIPCFNAHAWGNCFRSFTAGIASRM